MQVPSISVPEALSCLVPATHFAPGSPPLPKEPAVSLPRDCETNTGGKYTVQQYHVSPDIRSDSKPGLWQSVFLDLLLLLLLKLKKKKSIKGNEIPGRKQFHCFRAVLHITVAKT